MYICIYMYTYIFDIGFTRRDCTKESLRVTGENGVSTSVRSASFSGDTSIVLRPCKCPFEKLNTASG